METYAAKEQTAYAAAGGVAEEVLGAIRTVVSFGECESMNSSPVMYYFSPETLTLTTCHALATYHSCSSL